MTDMSDMFSRVAALNGDMSTWDVSRVTGMYGMFRSATFLNNISKWYRVSRTLTTCSRVQNHFSSDAFKWDVPSMTDMHDMGSGTTTFDIGISKRDVASVNVKYSTISTHTHNKPDSCRVTNRHGRA